MSPLYRFLIYFFPFPLGVIEWLIRASMQNADATEFLGPVLCSAALALLLPIIVPKGVEASTLNLPKDVTIPATFSIRRNADEKVVGVGVIVLLVGIAAWGVCLYLSIGGKLLSPLKEWIGEHDVKLWIGAILYITVTVLTEWKERT